MSQNQGIGGLSGNQHSVASRVGLGFVMALFVLGSFCSGWFFLSKATSRLAAANPVPNTGSEKRAGADIPSVPDSTSESAASVPAKQASDPRYAFLLLGYGGGGHDGAYLTDSMMVVIVDPNKKSLTMLSLPRDSWVPLIFNGQTAVYNKINTAYAFAKDASLYTNRLPRYQGSQGAGNFTMDTVARLLGIPISYYVAIDFQGFRQMIDAVGGIDVNVPDEFAANYPMNDDPAIDPRWTVVRFYKGMQHMNGERAIEYARARETIDNPSEGSDFARSRRQRLIMEAFKTKLMQAGGLIHIPQLLAIASGHIDTNYSVPSAAQLGQLLADWKNVQFYQTAATNQNYLSDATGPGGAYILVPNDSGYSWRQVRAFARQLWNDPAAGVAMANTEIVIENDTGVPGTAGRLGTALAKLGYNIGTPTTGTARINSDILDGTGGDGDALARQLQADLKVQLPVAQTDESADSGKIVIQLGSDNLALADLSVPADQAAPSSAAGVVQSNGWSPEVAAPEPTETPTPRAGTAAAHTLTPRPTYSTRPALPSGTTGLPGRSLQRTATPTTLESGRPGGGAGTAPILTHTPTPSSSLLRRTPTPTAIRPVVPLSIRTPTPTSEVQTRPSP